MGQTELEGRDIEARRCKRCGALYPKTPEFFPWNDQVKNRLRYECKPCWRTIKVGREQGRNQALNRVKEYLSTLTPEEAHLLTFEDLEEWVLR